MQNLLLPIGAKPFLIWVGGKRRIIRQISRHKPSKIGTYYEPFLGGGSMFFSLGSQIERAVLSDINSELITTYQVVKATPRKLINRLKTLADRYKEDNDFFYEVRNIHDHTDPLEIAARMIFLNKTCFNGKYEVNVRGEFSSSRGRRFIKIKVYEQLIMDASAILQKATIAHGGFDEVVKPEKDDFIYCDPPYDGTKIAYQKDGFSQDDQIRVRDAADRWRSLGANVMLSNAYTDNIRDLYKDYRIKTLKLKYTMNPLITKTRSLSDEALIMSYENDDSGQISHHPANKLQKEKANGT